MLTMSERRKEKQAKDEMKILAELEQNPNGSIDTIAKHCGCSRQKARRTIKRLEETRMIWGYTTIVDKQKQGLRKFILSIKRSQKILDEKSLNEIFYERLGKTLLNLGITIESSYYIHGEYDWVLIFTAKDLYHAKKFSDILFEAYPGAVDKVNLSQILFIQRDHRIENPDKSKLMDFL